MYLTNLVFVCVFFSLSATICLWIYVCKFNLHCCAYVFCNKGIFIKKHRTLKSNEEEESTHLIEANYNRSKVENKQTYWLYLKEWLSSERDDSLYLPDSHRILYQRNHPKKTYRRRIKEYFSFFLATSKNDACPICLEDFIRKQYIILLNCQHGYHESCLSTWLFRSDHISTGCPLCKSNVATEKIVTYDLSRRTHFSIYGAVMV